MVLIQLAYASTSLINSSQHLFWLTNWSFFLGLVPYIQIIWSVVPFLAFLSERSHFVGSGFQIHKCKSCGSVCAKYSYVLLKTFGIIFNLVALKLLDFSLVVVSFALIIVLDIMSISLANTELNSTGWMWILMSLALLPNLQALVVSTRVSSYFGVNSILTPAQRES